jgi:hypothetical protein
LGIPEFAALVGTTFVGSVEDAAGCTLEFRAYAIHPLDEMMFFLLEVLEEFDEGVHYFEIGTGSGIGWVLKDVGE